ncbi:MAG: GNAT family N-acetyltransferase [Clostridiales bacterium]|nr:GNAT family N-acetyltransferase [Clostridiales bacterium]
MYNIRPAVRSDSAEIFGLITALAEYEKMSDLVTGTADDLEKLLFDSGVGHCIVAEDGGRLIGMALYFYNLSTFKCRAGIHLEDLFVLPERRGEGIGKQLLHTLCQIAKDENLGRLEWECLDWNTPSLEFYHHMGAESLDEWVHLRVDESRFDEFLSK